jgi:hypothetical protein
MVKAAGTFEYHWEVVAEFWTFDMWGSEYFNASITDALGFGKIEHASGGALSCCIHWPWALGIIKAQ